MRASPSACRTPENEHVAPAGVGRPSTTRALMTPPSRRNPSRWRRCAAQPAPMRLGGGLSACRSQLDGQLHAPADREHGDHAPASSAPSSDSPATNYCMSDSSAIFEPVLKVMATALAAARGYGVRDLCWRGRPARDRRMTWNRHSWEELKRRADPLREPHLPTPLLERSGRQWAGWASSSDS